MTEGADIVIVTPGRMLSHLTLGYVDLSSLEVLILDEADRMLDMGFHADIMRIASHCRKERQTLLFSATMPDRMRNLAHELLNDPVTVQLALSKPAANVKQGAYALFDHQKDAVLVDVLKERNVKSGIVFTSRKRTVGQVVRALRKAGIKCGRMSSDLDQSEREEVMLAFRQQKLPILVATDVVSRGIDIDSIELVVNYDVPPNEEDYVHRIGRTARAQRKGEAITLVTPDDMRRFGKIEKLIEKEVPKLEVPKALGDAPCTTPSRQAPAAAEAVAAGEVGDPEAVTQAVVATAAANQEGLLPAVDKVASATSSGAASQGAANPKERDTHARRMARGALRRGAPRPARKRHGAPRLE